MEVTLGLISSFVCGWLLRGIVTGERFYERRKIEGYRDGLEVGRQEIFKWKYESKKSGQ